MTSSKRPVSQALLRLGRALVLGTLLVGALACRPDPGPEGHEALATEDVSLPPDALVDPSLDQQEAPRRSQSLAGQLPSDFPDDLPTYPGASITDFGDDGRWIEFLVPSPAERVAEGYARRLRAAGWTLDGPLRTDRDHTLTRSGRSVRLRLDPQGPSTRIAIHY